MRRSSLPRAVGVMRRPRARCRRRAQAASHGAVDVGLGVAFGDQRPRLAGVGVEGLERLARGGIAPLAVDVGLVLLELGRPVLHGGTPRRRRDAGSSAPRLVRDRRRFKQTVLDHAQENFEGEKGRERHARVLGRPLCSVGVQGADRASGSDPVAARYFRNSVGHPAARLLLFPAGVLRGVMRTSDQLLAELRTLHPKLIDLSLGRIERLLAKLGNPEARLPPVVHVAGTNGKGSTVAYLKAMLQAAGKRVHVYTSPHLVRFSERIELAGADGKARPIGEAELVDVLSRTQRANAGDAITFFEITTAAAFQAFAEHPADAVILEVGLGGRLDTTNVVARPALSVITPVSLDHQDKLGRHARCHRRREGRHPQGRRPRRRLPPAAGSARRHSRPRRRGARAALPVGRGLRGLRAARPPRLSERRAADGPAPAGTDGPPPGRQRRHRHRRRAAAEDRSAVADAAIERGLARRALAGAHAAARQRPAVAAAGAGLRAVARRRAQSGRRRGHRPDAGRAGGAGAQARRPDRRHDGPEGRRRRSWRISAASCAASSPCPSRARTRRRTIR